MSPAVEPTGIKVREETLAGNQLGMFSSSLPESGHDAEVYRDAGCAMEWRDNIEFMRRLPDGSVKLIVTSPPYNIGKLYEERAPLESYVQGQARVIAECVRLLHPKGSLCWQVGNYVEDGEVIPLDVVLYPLFKEHGLKLRNRIVWHFEHGLHCTRRLSGRYETINWFTKGGCYSQGESIEESLQNVREAIELYLEVLADEGRDAPQDADVVCRVSVPV